MPSSFGQQFFGKALLPILIGSLVLMGISGFALHHEALSLGILLFAGFGSGFLAYFSLEHALLLAWYEVLIGVHGYLVSATLFGVPLSLRMVLWIGIMAGWGLGMLVGKYRLAWSSSRDVPLCIWGGALAYGIFRGLATHAKLPALFDDANSYATLAYLLPLATLSWTPDLKRKFLMVLGGSVLSLFVITGALIAIFTHSSESTIWDIYVLVRDPRLFEVTLLSSPGWFTNLLISGSWYFRVFSQAHLSAGTLLLLMCCSILGTKRSLLWQEYAYLGVAVSVFAWSMSRSFALAGVLVGLVVTGGLFLLFVRDVEREQSIGRRCLRAFREVVLPLGGLFAKLGVLLAGSGLLFWLLVSLPLVSRPNLGASPFYRGEHDTTRTLAVSSRYNMLPPLREALEEHPFLGWGFGKEVTYTSDDPRIREATGGTGELTTYRYEWGFLDVWMKMGALGILAHAYLLVVPLGVLLQKTKRYAWSSLQEYVAHVWLELGVTTVLLFLFGVHMITPYLNHPLGIMTVMVMYMMLRFPESEQKEEEKNPLPLSLAFKSYGSVALQIRSRMHGWFCAWLKRGYRKDS